MAITQYIGARYAPLFYENSLGTSEWTPNTQYEPLTIVTRNGNSYTSKKPVPASAGAPENTPNYWVSTGIYNQQVDQYRQEVQEVKQRIGSKFLFVGDSFDVIYNDTSWSETCAALMQLDAADYYICSHGGCGLAPTSPQNDPWETLIDNDANIPSDIDTVIIGGGTNDNGNTLAALITAAESLDAYLKNRFVNLKKIYLSFMPVWYYGTTQFAELDKICAYYEQVCQKVGWIFTSGVESTMYDPDLINYTDYPDKVHPTKAGVKALGTNVYRAIVGGYASIGYRKEVSVTVDAALNYTGSAKTFAVFTHNNTIEVHDNNIVTFGGSSSALNNFVPVYKIPAMSAALPLGFFQPVTVKYGSTVMTCYLICQNMNEINLYLGGQTIPANTSFALFPWHLEATLR